MPLVSSKFIDSVLVGALQVSRTKGVKGVNSSDLRSSLIRLLRSKEQYPDSIADKFPAKFAQELGELLQKYSSPGPIEIEALFDATANEMSKGEHLRNLRAQGKRETVIRDPYQNESKEAKVSSPPQPTETVLGQQKAKALRQPADGVLRPIELGATLRASVGGVNQQHPRAAVTPAHPHRTVVFPAAASGHRKRLVGSGGNKENAGSGNSPTPPQKSDLIPQIYEAFQPIFYKPEKDKESQEYTRFRKGISDAVSFAAKQYTANVTGITQTPGIISASANEKYKAADRGNNIFTDKDVSGVKNATVIKAFVCIGLLTLAEKFPELMSNTLFKGACSKAKTNLATTTLIADHPDLRDSLLSGTPLQERLVH